MLFFKLLKITFVGHLMIPMFCISILGVVHTRFQLLLQCAFDGKLYYYYEDLELDDLKTLKKKILKLRKNIKKRFETDMKCVNKRLKMHFLRYFINFSPES